MTFEPYLVRDRIGPKRVACRAGGLDMTVVQSLHMMMPESWCGENGRTCRIENASRKACSVRYSGRLIERPRSVHLTGAAIRFFERPCRCRWPRHNRRCGGVLCNNL